MVSKIGETSGVAAAAGVVCSGVGELTGVGVAVALGAADGAASDGAFFGAAVVPSGIVLSAAALVDDLPRRIRWTETGLGLRADTSTVCAA